MAVQTLWRVEAKGPILPLHLPIKKEQSFYQMSFARCRWLAWYFSTALELGFPIIEAYFAQQVLEPTADEWQQCCESLFETLCTALSDLELIDEPHKRRFVTQSGYYIVHRPNRDLFFLLVHSFNQAGSHYGQFQVYPARVVMGIDGDCLEVPLFAARLGEQVTECFALFVHDSLQLHIDGNHRRNVGKKVMIEEINRWQQIALRSQRP